MTSWRDVLKIHPACELFPRMSPEELRELGEDIKANGLRHQVMLWQPKSLEEMKAGAEPVVLIDGCNRLDAMEMVGIEILDDGWLADEYFTSAGPELDPYSYVVSENIKRRHLTTEQRKDLAAEILKRQPERSDSSVAKEVGLSDKTVTKVRKSNPEIPDKADRVEASGRKARGRKAGGGPRKQPPSTGKVTEFNPTEPATPVEPDHLGTLKATWEAASDEDRRQFFLQTTVTQYCPQCPNYRTQIAELREKHEWVCNHQDQQIRKARAKIEVLKKMTPEEIADEIVDDNIDLDASQWSSEISASAQLKPPKPEPQPAAQTSVDPPQPEPGPEPAATPPDGDRVQRLLERLQALPENRQKWVHKRLDKPEDAFNSVKSNEAWADVRDWLTAFVAATAEEQAAIRAQLERRERS